MMARYSRVAELLVKNLKTGDPFPPRQNKSLLRVYGFQFCPYVERALLVLEAKKIPHEIVNVSLNKKPEWLFGINPFGKAPAIEFGPNDSRLYESIIVSTFLDEFHSHPPTLTPSDIYGRARQQLLIGDYDALCTSFLKAIFTRDHERLKVTLEKSEKKLKSKGTRFLGTQSGPDLVDYMFWPFVERIPALVELLAEEDSEEFLKKFYPATQDYIGTMLTDGAVQKVRISTEDHKEFFVLKAELDAKKREADA